MRMPNGGARAREHPQLDADRARAAREVDVLYSVAYEELRGMAHAALRREARATLSTTTLVHEAWLKLHSVKAIAVESPLHFKRIAARAMRRVLVEAARRRNTAKRGEGLVLVTFDESLDHAAAASGALIALDAALHELALQFPRQAEMIEMRYFAGLTVPETAEAMEISEATVHRDWRAARAWLAAELGRAE